MVIRKRCALLLPFRQATAPGTGAGDSPVVGAAVAASTPPTGVVFAVVAVSAGVEKSIHLGCMQYFM